MLTAIFGFLYGLVFGIAAALLVIGLAIIIYSKLPQNGRHKRGPKEYSYTYSIKSTALWLNLLIDKLYPTFIKNNIISSEIRNVVKDISGTSCPISSMNVKTFTLNTNSPKIEYVKLKTSESGDFIEIKFMYSPDAKLLSLANVNMLILGNVRIKISAVLNYIDGSILIAIPENYGRLHISLSSDTKSKFDIGADLHKGVHISSEAFGPIGSWLLNFFTSYIKDYEYDVTIEENLYYSRSKNNFVSKTPLIDLSIRKRSLFDPICI